MLNLCLTIRSRKDLNSSHFFAQFFSQVAICESEKNSPFASGMITDLKKGCPDLHLGSRSKLFLQQLVKVQIMGSLTIMT